MKTRKDQKFIEEEYAGETHWLAHLNDGTTVFQDESQGSSWTELKKHVEDSPEIKINNLSLGFREHVLTNISLAQADGYFFSRAVLGSPNSDRNIQFYLLGWVKDGRLTVQKYAVPELILMEQSERKLDLNSSCLILNNKDKFDVAKLERTRT